MALAIMLVAGVLATGSAQAQTYTESVLYSFQGGTNGGLPDLGLVLDAQGNLYGTTDGGGGGGGSSCQWDSGGCGTVFKVVGTTGQETVLHIFTGTPDGSDGSDEPLGVGLVQDTQGNLYGTTTFGGDAACFAEVCTAAAPCSS